MFIRSDRYYIAEVDLQSISSVLSFNCLSLFEFLCKAAPKEPKPGQCPVVESGGFGICVQECDDDSGCSGDQKCCSNGCGRTCMDPISMHVYFVIDSNLCGLTFLPHR